MYRAWKKQLAPDGLVCINSHFPLPGNKTDLHRKLVEIHFIADDAGAFTGAAGLLFDASPLLGAPRSKVSLAFSL